MDRKLGEKFVSPGTLLKTFPWHSNTSTPSNEHPLMSFLSMSLHGRTVYKTFTVEQFGIDQYIGWIFYIDGQPTNNNEGWCVVIERESSLLYFKTNGHLFSPVMCQNYTCFDIVKNEGIVELCEFQLAEKIPIQQEYNSIFRILFK